MSETDLPKFSEFCAYGFGLYAVYKFTSNYLKKCEAEDEVKRKTVLYEDNMKKFEGLVGKLEADKTILKAKNQIIEAENVKLKDELGKCELMVENMKLKSRLNLLPSDMST